MLRASRTVGSWVVCPLKALDFRALGLGFSQGPQNSNPQYGAACFWAKKGADDLFIPARSSQPYGGVLRGSESMHWGGIKLKP